MPLVRRRVTGAAALKALGHPVRIALLDALVSEGPLTASQAAALVDESPSNCSWHLRRLAEQGFVREARGGTGRNRPWQAVSEGIEWATDPADAPGNDRSGEFAAEALTDTMVEREVQRLRAARAGRDSEPPPWREASGLVHSQLWLTADEARQVLQGLTDLLASHAERSAGPDRRPEGARLVSLVGWLVPSGPLREPDPATQPK
jgi:DNA-binding transcriptional ArsR family regulator